jgi:hypothetical protein
VAEKNLNNSLRVFFYYMMVSSVLTMVTTHFEGKDFVDVMEDFFLRYMYGLVIGIPTGLSMMAGVDLYSYLKRKLKK